MTKRTLLIILTFILCLFIQDAFAAEPPPEPAPDIVVTDALAPPDDLKMPLDRWTLDTSTDFTVLIINNESANAPLTLYTITPPSLPFELLDTCSNTIVDPGNNCSLTVRFTPDATGDFYDSFDIPSDDPDEPTVTVRMSGRGITNSAENEPPTAPGLVSPENWAVDVVTPITFKWKKSTDPEGGPVVYDLYICEDSTFVTCEIPVAAAITASLAGKGFFYAGGALGLGFVLFGFVFASGSTGRRGVALLLAGALFASTLLLFACGNGGGGGGGGGGSAPPVIYEVPGGLTGGTTYFWKVVAEDDVGNRTDSEIWSFTTQ